MFAKKKKFIIVFILVLVILAVAGTAFFIERKSFSSNPRLAPIGPTFPVYDSVAQFYASAKDHPIQESVRWANFDKNQEKRKISLNEILPNVVPPSRERDVFVRYMSQEVFDVFQCEEKNGEASHGIYFIFAYLKDYSGDSYADARKALDAWGPYMLNDMNSIIFPDDHLTESNLKQELHFGVEYSTIKDLGLDYKKTAVSIGLAKKEVYYGVVGGNVILTTSENCLFTASKDLLSLVP